MSDRLTDTNVGNIEYINKHDAVEAVDKIFDNVPMELTTEILRLRRELRELPSADVVQVVRCKDCRKCSYDPLFNYYWCNLTLGTRRVKFDDFCSYGEREE